MIIRSALAILLALSAAGPVLAQQEPEFCFTPGQNCTHLIASHIKDAKKSIHIQAYYFSSIPIIEALMDAADRGASVIIVLDKSQVSWKKSKIKDMIERGVSVYIDKKHAISHNKIIIIDEKIVLTGSFNFTESAQERNAENIIIMNNSKASKSYMDNWREHFIHSAAYSTPEKKPRSSK